MPEMSDSCFPHRLAKGGQRLCFHPYVFVCFSVCLFVHEQDISKSYSLFRPKLGGQVRGMSRMNRFDVGEDLNADLETRIF